MNANFLPLNSVVFIDEEIIKDEYSYYFGEKKDVKVRFFYYNVKKDSATELIKRTYKDALTLALSRRADGRYKNYEFYIQL